MNPPIKGVIQMEEMVEVITTFLSAEINLQSCVRDARCKAGAQGTSIPDPYPYCFKQHKTQESQDV